MCNFMNLASLCSWAGRIESDWSETPKTGFLVTGLKCIWFHEKRDLSILGLVIFQMHRWTWKALARLCRRAGSLEPWLFAYVITTLFTWASPCLMMLVIVFVDKFIFLFCSVCFRHDSRPASKSSSHHTQEWVIFFYFLCFFFYTQLGPFECSLRHSIVLVKIYRKNKKTSDNQNSCCNRHKICTIWFLP